MVRKKGIGLLAIIAFVIFLLIILFRDSLIERFINRAGNSILGAKVEFHGVHYSIFKNSLSWESLEVTNPYDPMRNLFEIKTSYLDIQLEPLLYKRYIFKTARFDSLRLNTGRKKSGALSGKYRKSSSIAPFFDTVAIKLDNKLEELSLFNTERLSSLNIDSIIKVADFNTPHRIDSLRNIVEQRSKIWNEKVAGLPGRDAFSDVQKRIDSINPDSIKTIPQVAAALSTINRIHKKIDSIKTVIDSINNIVQSDIAIARRYDTLVGGWISDNYGTLLLIAHLPQITKDNASEYLFGPAVIKKIQSAIPYFGIARYYGEKARAFLPDKKTNLPRRMGQEIPFPDKHGWPQFWIKELSINGTLFQNVDATGIAKNLVSRQELIGQPTSVELGAAQSEGPSLSLNAVFNYLEALSLERFGMDAKRVSLDSIDLYSQLIPLKLSKGLGDISGAIQSRGNTFAAQAGFIGTNLLFNVTDTSRGNIDPQILILRDSLIHSINQLSINAITRMVDTVFTLNITSNIAQRVADLMKKIPIQALETAKAELRKRLYSQLEPKRRELESEISRRTAGIQDSLSFRNELFKKLLQIVEEKSKDLKGLPF